MPAKKSAMPAKRTVGSCRKQTYRKQRCRKQKQAQQTVMTLALVV